MSRTRRPVFWLLFLGFAGALVWWTLYVPYKPASLYRVIPAQSTVLSAHHDLAGRWDDIAGNPAGQSLFQSLGLDAEELPNLGKDPEFRKWLRILASDELVFAYVPSLGADLEPAWVFASWLGAGSHRLRWLLGVVKVPGIQKVFDQAGHHVWVVQPGLLKGGEVISFSLVEGMVIGSVSRSVTTTAQLLNCFDGRYPSLGGRAEMQAPPRAAGADRGWFKPGRGGIYTALRAQWTIPLIKPDGLRAELTWPEAFLGAAQTGASLDLAGLRAALGPWPLAYAVVDHSLAEGVLKTQWTNGLGTVLGDLVATYPGDMALCMLAGDLSGRFKGLKLPTVIAALELEDPQAFQQALPGRFDAWNARHRWGLVPREIKTRGGEVYAVESTADTLYARLAPEETVAYAITGNWLLVASNLEGFTNLMSRSVPAPQADILATAATAAAPLAGQINLVDGAKALRVALTAYGVKLAMENPRGSQPMRQRLNEAKAWIDAMAPLQTLRFEARPDDDQTRILLEAGNVR